MKTIDVDRRLETLMDVNCRWLTSFISRISSIFVENRRGIFWKFFKIFKSSKIFKNWQFSTISMKFVLKRHVWRLESNDVFWHQSSSAFDVRRRFLQRSMAKIDEWRHFNTKFPSLYIYRQKNIFKSSLQV